MRILATGIVCGLLVVASGCSDQPTQPLDATKAFSPSLSRGAASESQLQGIAGSAKFVYTDGIGEAFEEHVANAATQKKDGGLKGEFEWHQRGTSTSQFDADFGGEIACFAVAGNTARVTGLIKRSNSPQLPPGTYVIWEWRDNDGATKAPDAITNFFVAAPETATRHCALGGVLDANIFYPATNGKLEILHDDH